MEDLFKFLEEFQAWLKSMNITVQDLYSMKWTPEMKGPAIGRTILLTEATLGEWKYKFERVYPYARKEWIDIIRSYEFLKRELRITPEEKVEQIAQARFRLRQLLTDANMSTEGIE